MLEAWMFSSILLSAALAKAPTLVPLSAGELSTPLFPSAVGMAPGTATLHPLGYPSQLGLHERLELGASAWDLGFGGLGATVKLQLGEGEAGRLALRLHARSAYITDDRDLIGTFIATTVTQHDGRLSGWAGGGHLIDTDPVRQLASGVVERTEDGPWLTLPIGLGFSRPFKERMALQAAAQVDLGAFLDGDPGGYLGGQLVRARGRFRYAFGLVIQSGDVEIESFEQENYKMTEAGSGVAACGSLWWRL
jgi:hypothetical protein